MQPVSRIDTVDLFPGLNRLLITLLRSMSPDGWNAPTVCDGWSVKDIAAHLLDTNIRKLSAERDAHRSPPPTGPITGYVDLVTYINSLNAEWVSAFRRVSPAILTDLLESTGEQLAAHVASLDPDADALFPVCWAGQSRSPNWLDTAREYTEKWHHQQQIRDAVGAEPLTERRYLHAVLDTFLRALPHRYRDTDAPAGATITMNITGPAGGNWTLVRSPDSWLLHTGQPANPTATIELSQDVTWRFMTKGIAPSTALSEAALSGPASFTGPFFSNVAVIA
jgi:uncharacterized protein (TIGR03083 family)